MIDRLLRTLYVSLCNCYIYTIIADFLAYPGKPCAGKYNYLPPFSLSREPQHSIVALKSKRKVQLWKVAVSDSGENAKAGQARRGKK